MKTLHCQLMFEVFAKFPVTTISFLDLTNNNFNQFACKSLANFMQISTTLKTLILRRCKYDIEIEMRMMLLMTLGFFQGLVMKEQNSLVMELKLQQAFWHLIYHPVILLMLVVKFWQLL